MRTKDDLLVGGLYQDINDRGNTTDRYYVELGCSGYSVPIDRDKLDDFGVPTGVIMQSWTGYMGAIYTTLSTGENYFIAE